MPTAASRSMMASSTSSISIRRWSVFHFRRRGVLAHRHAQLVSSRLTALSGKLPGRDVAGATASPLRRSLVEQQHLMVLFQQRGDAAQHGKWLNGSSGSVPVNLKAA